MLANVLLHPIPRGRKHCLYAVLGRWRFILELLLRLLSLAFPYFIRRRAVQLAIYQPRFEQTHRYTPTGKNKRRSLELIYKFCVAHEFCVAHVVATPTSSGAMVSCVPWNCSFCLSLRFGLSWKPLARMKWTEVNAFVIVGWQMSRNHILMNSDSMRTWDESKTCRSSVHHGDSGGRRKRATE